MTREETIEELIHCVDWAEHFDETYADNVPVAALKMAIEALAQPVIGNCENCKWCEKIAEDRYSCNCQNSLVLGSYVEPDFYCKYWAERTKVMTREEAITKLMQLKNKFLDEYIDYDGTTSAYDLAIEALHQPEPITLTYDEKCIFLSAIGRERRICQEMDAEDGTIIKPLVPIVDTIIRKVRAVLWEEDNAFMSSVSTEKSGKWNSIKTRPLNDEEIKLWAEQHGCECEEYGEGDDYMCDGYMCLPPLPREGEKVLVCDASGHIDFYTYHIASQFELGTYDETDEDRPVAWMSLPEPYEEREE